MQFSTPALVLPRFARAGSFLCLLCATAFIGCQPAPKEPVTLSYFRLGWSQPDEPVTAEPLSQKFTRETGIQLKNLPVPETTLDQLAVSRKQLQGGSGLDVLGVDIIWTGVLKDDLVDLRPYLTEVLTEIEPNLLPSYTVDGRLVAVPYTIQIGSLEYRSDLLREYGYDHPPKTWDELEIMARKIQTGERAKGNKDFWGYVWQGADVEALTCNALEWQFSEGGGRIIENDKTISVNNPAAIRSWKRAKHWIGLISPPSVVNYREIDSINVFDSGRAAFNRVWGGVTVLRGGQSRQVHWRSGRSESKTGYTSIPSGPGGRAGTLGGGGLAISSHSLHGKEALQLVRFLIREAIREGEQDEKATANQSQASNMPSVASPTEEPAPHRSGVVARPSNEAGPQYEQVARAYIAAVHSVLTGERDANAVAADLEAQLIKITGFAAGPPKPSE